MFPIKDFSSGQGITDTRTRKGALGMVLKTSNLCLGSGLRNMFTRKKNLQLLEILNNSKKYKKHLVDHTATIRSQIT